MKKTILPTLLIMMMSIPATAQDARQLKVTVTDKNGENVKGLNVYGFIQGQVDIRPMKNDRYLTFDKITDRDTLNLVLDDTIYIFPLEGVDSLKITMKNRRKPESYTKNANEVVDNGFFAIPTAANTLPVNNVDVTTITNYRDLASYMEGRVPGVEVIRTGAAVDLRVRGVSSINSGTSPLIVVDGIPAENFNIVNSYINPQDIASITVDKDGTLYGQRGANGVVIITTKKR